MNLPQLPQDKANHFAYGAAIGVISSFATIGLGHPELSRLVPLVAAGLAGAVKELADWLQNRQTVKSGGPPTHDVDVLDFLATLCGGLLVSARP